MKTQIKYIELKTGFADNGPAWIAAVGIVENKIYFKGRVFKGDGMGICNDLENGEIYWISDFEENGQDRHWARKTKILIDRKLIDEYLRIMKLEKLDKKKFEIIDL